MERNKRPRDSGAAVSSSGFTLTFRMALIQATVFLATVAVLLSPTVPLPRPYSWPMLSRAARRSLIQGTEIYLG